MLLDLPPSFSVSCELAGSPSPHPAFAGSSAEVTGLQSNSPYDVQVVRRGSSADPLFRGVKGGLDVQNGRETGSRQRVARTSNGGGCLESDQLLLNHAFIMLKRVKDEGWTGRMERDVKLHVMSFFSAVI